MLSKSILNHRLDGATALDCQSVAFVENLWRECDRDEQAVSDQWRRLFAKVGDGNGFCSGDSRKAVPSQQRTTAGVDRYSAQDMGLSPREVNAEQIRSAFRDFGHLAAQIDPLGMHVRESDETILLKSLGITAGELDDQIVAKSSNGQLTARQLVARLSETYCRSTGYEFQHIDEPEKREWLVERIERRAPPALPIEIRRRWLQRLIEATQFEQLVRKKFPGAKTFSLEGSESLIPLLDFVIQRAAVAGVDEIVIGMAHRGRLNVLTNIIGKPLQLIFCEFEDHRPETHRGRGDVKYHLGHSGDWPTDNGHRLHLSLCFNPSHLEFVGPVAMGRLRAKQDRAGDNQRQRGLVILIHGDAAFAGEGVVQETLNLSDLDAYRTGGTLHIIVNNQLGFTTPPASGRSGKYATNAARMLNSPIWHVNGEDQDAVVRAADMAWDFLREFQRDVFIDLVGYRRWGHNESDEPSFTQPLLYRAIEHHQPPVASWAQRLIDDGTITESEVKSIQAGYDECVREAFEQRDESANSEQSDVASEPRGIWQGYVGGAEPADLVSTIVEEDRLRNLLQKLTRFPTDLHVHAKLHRSIAARRKMATNDEPLDWPTAEALAFASLAADGISVRLAGQDTERGTFSQRHGILHDVVDGHRYSIFAPITGRSDAGAIDLIDSPLSEVGALAFEYGYSLDAPDALVLWEAQFGDFVNAAQVIIDQCLASAEDKWNRLSGLVLLLPHGFEGQGPEHSSARLERFLSLAAEDNLQIVQPTTPAQYFHCLRRQVLSRWRKPLIVLTPKSLLRHPRVRSQWNEFSQRGFERVLGDDAVSDPSRLLLCSGKVYYDLLAYRQKHDEDGTAILRLEQFYPLRDEQLHSAFDRYVDDLPVVWVQEEPANMGAWQFLKHRLGDRLLGTHPFHVVARPASASPATGSSSSHKAEQETLLQQAFERDKERRDHDR